MFFNMTHTMAHAYVITHFDLSLMPQANTRDSFIYFSTHHPRGAPRVDYGNKYFYYPIFIEFMKLWEIVIVDASNLV